MMNVQEAFGLYDMDEKLPCGPNEIRFRRYLLPSTLGNVETEEAAARLLSYSQDVGRWVGVSWPRMVATMREELDFERAGGGSGPAE